MVRVMLFITPISTTFKLYLGSQCYWWRKTEDPDKTTDLSQVIDKLYHMYTSPLAGFKLTTLVVIGTNRAGRCKSNYRTNLTTTTPLGIGIYLIPLYK